MPQHPDDFSEKIESGDDRLSGNMSNAQSLNEWKQTATQLLHKLESQGFATRTTAAKYKEAIDAEKDPEGMKAFYEWMKQGAEKADQALKTLDREMDHAVRSKVMNEQDRAFLMSHLVLTDQHDFIGQKEMNTITELLHEKINRMKQDREAYDTMANHSLIKEKGVLVVGKNMEIKLPDEAGFLAMKTPERRALIKKLQDALPKAEAYARVVEGKEGTELNKVYTAQLDRALSEKIIGKKTYQKFLQAFEKQTVDTKKQWANKDVFENEMKRYRVLWQQIRTTLRGPILKKMEGQRDDMGYTELLTHFGHLQESEKKQLRATYIQSLGGYHQKGIVSRHTVESFVREFDTLDLGKRYEWTDKIAEVMKPYEVLTKQEADLPKQARDFLKKHFDKWGYTERSNFLKNPNLALAQQGDEKTDYNKALGVISDRSKRAAIIEAKEYLESRGEAQKESFISRAKALFSGKSSTDEGASNFTETLRKKRAGQQGVSTKNHQGFEQAEYVDEKGNKARVVQLDINKVDGMNSFLHENNQRRFEGESTGGQDDVLMSVQREDGTRTNLKVTEIRAMAELLKQKDDALDRVA